MESKRTVCDMSTSGFLIEFSNISEISTKIKKSTKYQSEGQKCHQKCLSEGQKCHQKSYSSFQILEFISTNRKSFRTIGNLFE